MEFITQDYLEKNLTEQGKVPAIVGQTLNLAIMSHHKSFQDVLWIGQVVCVQVHQTTITKDGHYFEMDLAFPIPSEKGGLYHIFRHVSVQKKKIKPKNKEPMEVLVVMSQLASFNNHVIPDTEMVTSSLEELNSQTSSVQE